MSDNKTYLRCSGVGRDADYDRSLVVYFNRRPTDDEMRRVHDAVSAVLATDTVAEPIVIPNSYSQRN